MVVLVFFFKQKTAYEMRISDWSSDVCSSDLFVLVRAHPCQSVAKTALPGPRRRALVEECAEAFLPFRRHPQPRDQIGVGRIDCVAVALPGHVADQPLCLPPPSPPRL